MKFKEYLFSKKYGSLYYRLSYFFGHKLPFSHGWNEYHNPLYPWFKCRKYFRRPNIHLLKGKNIWFFGLPCRRDYYNKIIDIRFSSLGWKDKYNSPRHEWDPYISIVFLRKYHLIWIFNYVVKGDSNGSTRNIATWEAMLDYLFYGRTLDQCKKSHVWLSGLYENAKEITINRNLK